MTAKHRQMRAEFLMNWFLSVFDGRKAPFPRRCFNGVAHHMTEFLATGGQYEQKFQDVKKARAEMNAKAMKRKKASV